MRNFTRTATCVAALVALSGCQSFVSALGFGPKDGAKRAEASKEAIFGNDELERGRAALRAGYPAAAIKQFRMAALNPEAAPDAFNGLGVAYAKLGRADLAERYFKMALDLDATNPRYAANLERFYNSPLGNSVRALAMRKKEAELAMAEAEAAAEQQGLVEPEAEAAVERRGAVTLERPGVRITRSSGRELRLVTSQPEVSVSRGARPEVAVRNPAKRDISEESEATEAEAKPERKPVRIMSWGTSAKSDQYPVRISLVRPDTAGRVAPKKANYPLRIRLQPAE